MAEEQTTNIGVEEIEYNGRKLYLFDRCAFSEKETMEMLTKIQEEREKLTIASALLQKVNEKKAEKIVEETKKVLKDLFEKHMGEIYGCMNDVLKKVEEEFKTEKKVK